MSGWPSRRPLRSEAWSALATPTRASTGPLHGGARASATRRLLCDRAPAGCTGRHAGPSDRHRRARLPGQKPPGLPGIRVRTTRGVQGGVPGSPHAREVRRGGGLRARRSRRGPRPLHPACWDRTPQVVPGGLRSAVSGAVSHLGSTTRRHRPCSSTQGEAAPASHPTASRCHHPLRQRSRHKRLDVSVLLIVLALASSG